MNNRQRTDEEPLKEKLTKEERLKNQNQRMEEEAALIEKLKKGETIVLNIHRHPAAITSPPLQDSHPQRKGLGMLVPPAPLPWRYPSKDGR